MKDPREEIRIRQEEREKTTLKVIGIALAAMLFAGLIRMLLR